MMRPRSLAKNQGAWRRVGALAAVLLGLGAAAAAPDEGIHVAPHPGRSATTRIVLEQVIDQRSLEKTGGKLVRWITGAAQSQILERPYGVAWDGDDLLVTDPGAGRVVRLGRRGKLQASRPGEFQTPIGVAVCRSGTVVTDAQAGRVTLLNRKLRAVRDLATGLARPTGVACADGKVYVVETGAHRVLVLDPAAKSGAEPVVLRGRRGDGPGEFNFPVAICFRHGSLWVGDTLNFRIQRFDGERAEFRDEFGNLGDAPGEMPRIKGIALDDRGHLWVTDAHLNQISVYGQDGRFLMHLGGTGDQPGRFSFPAGLAAHEDGRVAVVDSLNRRLQIFRVERPEPPGSS